MIETKTFKEIINNGYVYPSIIPQDLQATIYYWYQDRHVADDDKFPLWFTRLLLKDYKHYNELLRIEPGITQYDWLVTQYMELQRQKTGEYSDTTGEEGSKNSTLANTRTTEESVKDTESSTKSNTNTLTGTKATSGTRDTDTDNNTTTSGTDVTDEDTTETVKSDTKGMTRALPLSITTNQAYWTEHEISDAHLDWSTATDQSGSGTNGRTTGTDDISVTHNSTTDFDGDVSEKYSDTTTDNRTVTDAGTGSKTGSRSIEGTTTDSGTNVETSSNDITKTGSNSDLTREIYTGRQGKIAEILEEAKTYIETTDAWNWLSKQIDTVFMGVYDI